MSVPKSKAPKPGGSNSLIAQVKGLQSSVQRWDGRLKEFEKSHISLMSQHDAKISKLATKLKAIRVKLKTGNRRIKTLESKLRDAVESNDGSQDADERIGHNNIFPESKSSHEEPVLGSGKEDVAQADEETLTVAKRKRKRDSSQAIQKKHIDDSEEISPVFADDTDHTVLSKPEPQNDFHPEFQNSAPTRTGFQKKRFSIYIERIEESEILKFSPKKNENRNSIDSVIKGANSDTEANKESPISVRNEIVTTGSSNCTMSEETEWLCNVCGETFRWRKLLREHRRNSHFIPQRGRSKGTFPCPYCSAKFSCRKNVVRHTLVHSRDHQCSLCGASYNSKEELTRHLKCTIHHRIDAKKPFQCSLCLKSFSSYRNLNRHAIHVHEQDTSEKSVIEGTNVKSPPSESVEFSQSVSEVPQELYDGYECPVCGKNYKSLHQVSTHLRKHGRKNLKQIDSDSHIGVEPNQLEKNPDQSNGMPKKKKCNVSGVDLKIQESDKPRKSAPSPAFEIPSVQPSQSSETQNFITESTKKQTYECPTCHKNFTEEKNFDDHKKLHARGRVYNCPICTKRHTVKVALTKHLNSKHPEKHCHECPVCESMHFSINNLHRHVKRHNVQDIYKCNKCTQSFPNRNNWKDHLDVCSVLVLDAYKNQISKNAECNTIISLDLPTSPKAKSRKKVVHKCVTCSGNFSTAQSLRRHINNVHLHLNKKALSTTGSHFVKNKIKRKIFSKMPQPISPPKNDAEGKDAEIKTTGTVTTCHDVPNGKGKENSRAEAEQPVTCLTCQKVYASRKNLRRHEKTHTNSHTNRSTSRSVLPGKNYACNFCKALHVTWAEFQGHMGAHELLFTKVKKLPSAFRGRSSITKFLCSECNKECETSEILKVHFAKTHAWKKNYKCKVSLCDRSFCTSEGLRRHSKLHHKDRLDIEGL